MAAGHDQKTRRRQYFHSKETPEPSRHTLLAPIRKTTITESYYGEDGVEVEFADITTDQLFLLEERIESDWGEYVWFPDNGTGESMMRSVLKVKRVQDKWLQSLKWEEDMERIEGYEDSTSESDG